MPGSGQAPPPRRTPEPPRRPAAGVRSRGSESARLTTPQVAGAELFCVRLSGTWTSAALSGRRRMCLGPRAYLGSRSRTFADRYGMTSQETGSGDERDARRGRGVRAPLYRVKKVHVSYLCLHGQGPAATHGALRAGLAHPARSRASARAASEPTRRRLVAAYPAWAWVRGSPRTLRGRSRRFRALVLVCCRGRSRRMVLSEKPLQTITTTARQRSCPRPQGSPTFKEQPAITVPGARAGREAAGRDPGPIRRPGGGAAKVPAGRAALPRAAGFWLVAGVLFLMLVASAAASPLYSVYQAQSVSRQPR